MAIALVAGGLYTTSRFLNMMLSEDGNPRMDLKHMFSVVIGDREYTLRSLPGDMFHLFTDPRSYIYHRLSPLVSNGIEHLTKRDSFGRPVGWKQEVIDLLMQPVPILLQTGAEEISHKFLGTQAVRYDKRDLIARAIGLSPLFYKDENEVRRWVNKWKSASNDPKLVNEV